MRFLSRYDFRNRLVRTELRALSLLSFLVTLFSFSSFAFGGSKVTYHGRIVKSDVSARLRPSFPFLLELRI